MPALLKLILPLEFGILILLLPFARPVTVIPVKYIPLPVKKLADTLFPKLALPDVMLPVTAKFVNVPTLVMFGCELLVNVPVNKLAPIVPELEYILPLIILPVTSNPLSVPRLVKLAEVIPDASVEPVKLAAFGALTTSDAAVN